MSTASHTKYDALIRHAGGHLRAPFSHVGFYLTLQGVTPSASERRAIENAVQFLVSLSIFARRLRAHLESYQPESWVDVPLYELFLDTQGLFLFTQQYLEDMASIVRLSLPHTQRHQMPAAFHQMVKRLREGSLTDDDPLKAFLDQEAGWLEELRDVRDDICHRTAYGRVRASTFPNLVGVLRAGGTVEAFLSASDLRGYVGGLFRRVLALSCVAETFVYSGILSQHPAGTGGPPAIVVADDEFDPSVSTEEPLFPLGTVIMTFSRTSLENLEYFLKAADGPANLGLQTTAADG